MYSILTDASIRKCQLRYCVAVNRNLKSKIRMTGAGGTTPGGGGRTLDKACALSKKRNGIVKFRAAHCSRLSHFYV